jgi:AraC-like DNA-binding protein
MESVLLKDINPSLVLQDYIRKYQVFRFVFNKDVIPQVKFHTPRPEHSITFYVRDLQKYSNLQSDKIVTYPRCVINGIYTIPINRHGGYDFWAIKIVLQPTTLSRLKFIPVNEITNRFISAEEVFSKEISFICEQLCMSNELDVMIKIIERFLSNLIKKKCSSPNPFDKACSYIFKQNKYVRLGWLADQSCLSTRQFIRKFENQIGLSPKTFQKIIRFERAIRMKNNYPNYDWLSIAIANGYYDYQHLVKDFKEFTGLTPPCFYEIEKKSPERTFGLHEG